MDAAKALSAAELASLRNYTITRLGLATWQRPQVLCSLTQEDVTSSPGDHFVSTEIGNVFKKKVLEHKTTATVCINYFLCVCTLPETGVHLSIIWYIVHTVHTLFTELKNKTVSSNVHKTEPAGLRYSTNFWFHSWKLYILASDVSICQYRLTNDEEALDFFAHNHRLRYRHKIGFVTIFLVMALLTEPHWIVFSCF